MAASGPWRIEVAASRAVSLSAAAKPHRGESEGQAAVAASILGTAGTPAVARRLAVETRESGATLQQIADRLTDESA